MPLYEFKCLGCTENNRQIRLDLQEKGEIRTIENYCDDYTFTIKGSMSAPPVEATCPECNQITQSKVFSFSVQYGLTREDKEFGTSKGRLDYAKHIRNEREKRKKTAKPGTKDYDSNELWTGTETERGVISKTGL